MVRSRAGKPLTTRHVEVLELLACGLSNFEIADELNIGLETVKSHVQRVLQALGASNRAHAVALGFQSRILTAAKSSQPN